MPTPIVAGNWKMNTTIEEAADLASAMVDGLDAVAGIEKVICPAFVSLAAVAEVLRGSTVALGAQNMYHEAEGAFTGEVSPTMLAPVCRFVILGHSERRQLFGETDDLVSLKVQAARRFGLRPIVCVGEHLKEREASRAEQVVEDQIRASLCGVTDSAGLVVAYEPVWAIGTGMAATPEIAGAMMSRIRAVLTSLFGAGRASDVPLLYGGSVNPGNAGAFMEQTDVNGALVGGASLEPESFVAIARSVAGASE
jgi:triosephosphate isomerase